MQFPAFGKSDLDIYENNFLEVMQFVFNHSTFDLDDKLDQAVIAALKPFSVEPGIKFGRVGGRVKMHDRLLLAALSHSG